MIKRMDLSISEIDKLRQQLADTDYKVIKQAEAQFAAITPLPYNAEEMFAIYAERESIREKIRVLE